MSETTAIATPEAPATESVAPPAEPPSTPDGAVTVPEPDDYSDLAGLDPKWAKEVKSLRKEAAERRVTHKPYEEAFKPYSDEERQVWLGLAQLTASDPKAGAKAFRDLAEALEEGLEPAEAAAEAGIPAPDEDKPLTKKELDAYMAKQKQELAVDTAAAQIEAQAKAAGYEPGSKGYKLLLTRAIELNYDLDAAIKEEASEKQAIIDKFVADKVAAGEKWPSTPGPGGSGSPNSGANQPKNFEEAKAALLEKLRAEAGK